MVKANRLLLVQHAENYATLIKEFSHQLVDYPLTSKGHRQTARHLSGFSETHVFSSPLEGTAHHNCVVGELGAHLKNSALVLRLVSWAGRSGLSGEAAFVSDTPQAGEPEEPRA